MVAIPILAPAKIRKFQRLISSYYARHGRDLPWRKTGDPYKIIVSEIMLQQTQVARVSAKYPSFIKAFPTIQVLARAPLQRILSIWQGLGYNRRALSLKKMAQVIVSKYKGKVPTDRNVLRRLPGVGDATSGAIMAFAFNQPEPFIETNIRSVFLSYFFHDKRNIDDKRLLPYVALTLDRKRPKVWYNALMDYGVYLKSNFPNPGRESLHYRRQGAFAGSDRQIRGAILKVILKERKIRVAALCAQLKFNRTRIKAMMHSLAKDGLLRIENGFLRI